ncbi:C40 family peptidase [Tepidibacillus fermentans]|uniref:Cell wall-associated NlpC family hydrolase n=1 Tax=Tepidibacillus fermentans TaxID=1281767 RepID=A0A4R3KAB1_9BACI|nr:C40 family peptidase [Tepidibacillus fermentans]TCS79885.1 cell wall-associated NlpC family hydrolase [Tepidibacillus fermentans]
MRLPKKKSAFILSSMLVGTLAFGGMASAQAAITTGSVNFRTAPTTNSQVVGVVPKGEQVEVINQVNNSWSKVTYEYKGKNYTGYISNRYYTLQDGWTSPTITIEQGKKAIITGSVNFRSEPSLQGTVLGKVPKGDIVNVLQEVNQYWSKVTYEHEGILHTGYISNRYFSYVDGTSSQISIGQSQQQAVPDTANPDLVQTPAVSNPTTQTPVNPSTEQTTKADWEKKADAIIQTGLKYWGTEYRLGADYDRDGSYLFDCSSFTEQIYEENGIDLLRSSRQQATQGVSVKRSEIRKGDLAFFATQGDYVNGQPRIDHVAIVKDVKPDGTIQLLHTYKKGIGVTTSTMYPNKGYWNDTFLFAKRVIQ